MNSIENKVQFGAKLNYALTPKEGFEIESVEVFNQTANQIVPCQLTKTNDNPPQYTCSFVQPAGVVAIRPKTRPILYSVIIEECENCSVVLVESNDAVDIQIASAAESTTESTEQNESVESNDENPHPETEAESSQDSENENSAPQKDVGATGEAHEKDGQGEAVNFNIPQHSVDTEENADEASDVEENETNDAVEVTQDSVYDAGEFAKELEEIEPTIITQAEVDKKNKAYWQHRNAFIAGQISKEEFDKVEKKHMEFLDDISRGLIEVKES